MVTCHNALLDCIQMAESHSKEAHMSRYIQEDLPSVSPIDVTENTCIVGRSEAYVYSVQYILQLTSSLL